jgi:recombination protein RecT
LSVSEKALAQKELSASERFMNKVVSEFSTGVGEIALTTFQRRLAQNYFISIDGSLKAAEEKRLKKKGKADPLAITWGNVNMEKLARDVVSRARIGFDPAQPNHINMMPFKNNNLSKYDIVFIEGYRGVELKATKYGLNVPDGVVVELVHSNDRFKSIKKDRNNPVETYDFEIVSDFDRGDIVGGFYYYIYSQAPEKNKLVVMSIKEVEKRKPQYASAEFWGGEKDKWENGAVVGKEKVEGWYDQMVYKTIYRAAYGGITIDSQKIDDDYMQLKQSEADFAQAEVQQEILENGNKQPIDITADVRAADEAPDVSQDDPVQGDLYTDFDAHLESENAAGF